MHVVVAQVGDFSSWLSLAAEVEFLFGPMVNEPNFRQVLDKNISRGTAYCVREGGGKVSVPLLGGLLFSPKPPKYTIGWLAVARQYRRRGIGHRLVKYVFGLVQPPAEMIVTTFGEDIEAGRPARRFYRKLGFHPAEMAPDGPEGGSRQIYRRIFH